MIKALLIENGATGLDESTVHISADGPEAPPSDDVGSTETYVGYARAENFASPEQMASDARRNYSSPAQLALNQWGLSGVWKIAGEKATLA
ncbi:MAG: cytochrome c biogenesis protein DipZ, partial [Acidobacteriaceae bacterium]|nr:cytochrome c biogenesis protein DipZ [Acidobacteriaceae bacterium]